MTDLHHKKTIDADMVTLFNDRGYAVLSVTKQGFLQMRQLWDAVEKVQAFISIDHDKRNIDFIGYDDVYNDYGWAIVLSTDFRCGESDFIEVKADTLPAALIALAEAITAKDTPD